jgi:hypothetical protein
MFAEHVVFDAGNAYVLPFLLTYLLTTPTLSFDSIRQGGPTRTSAVSVPRLAGFSLTT